MRAILFLLAVLSTNAMAGVLVIGDSMSAQVNSWPAYYREYTGDNVMVMAQNGRTIRDFTLPNDLHADGNIDTAIYLLGGNDMFMNTGPFMLAERVLTHLRFLKDRGFRVIVVKVPEFYGREAEIRKINGIITRKARGLKLEVIDLMPIWDTHLTSDTVHPKPELSRMIAQCVITALGQ